MQSRMPLLNTLRRAFQIALQSEKQDQPAVDELIEQQQYNRLHRRKFLGDIMKTGVAVGAAGVFNACTKVNDLMPASTSSLDGSATSKSLSKNSQPKIVIIGAGIAGLNCAYQLKKSGYASTIYEAANRTGGRMFTKSDVVAPGLYTELGGEFIDTEHKDMLQLCKEFGLPLIDTRTREEMEYARDSFYIDGRFYSEAEVINAFQPYAARIAADIRSLPVTMTYDNYDATTLRFDMMSIAGYLDSIGMTGFIRKGIEIAYVTEYGLEADVQSSINFLYLFSPKTNQGFEIFGTSDERYKIEGGNQTLTNRLYDEVKSQVFLEHQLIRIKEAANGYTLYFKNGNTTTQVNADILVSTIPFSVLRDVELNVALPAWKQNAIKNLGYGNNSKLLLGFNSRVWRNYKYSGYVFTDKAIQTGWDNSFGQNSSKGGFTVYGGGDGGLELGTGTADTQATKFIDQLEKMWPGCKKEYNGKAKRMHWPKYAYTKGSYACYKVGQYTSIRGAEIKPVGNFFFAGEHCSSYYQGFMNGGAETGRMAAHSILKVVKPASQALPA
jgi:monoamine oxidase